MLAKETHKNLHLFGGFALKYFSFEPKRVFLKSDLICKKGRDDKLKTLSPYVDFWLIIHSIQHPKAYGDLVKVENVTAYPEDP